MNVSPSVIWPFEQLNHYHHHSFLFMEGFSCRAGILDILTILSFPLCDTLSIACQDNSFLYPAETGSKHLDATLRDALDQHVNCCAVLSRYTNPYSFWRLYVYYLCIFFACFFLQIDDRRAVDLANYMWLGGHVQTTWLRLLRCSGCSFKSTNDGAGRCECVN